MGREAEDNGMQKRRRVKQRKRGIEDQNTMGAAAARWVTVRHKHMNGESDV